MIIWVFVGLILLILLGMPASFSLGIVSLYYLYANGIDMSMIAQSMSRGVNSFTMLAIPFFFMAGELMNTSGVTERIINMSKVMVGHMKGGLAQANIVASIIFAGISGSATADTAALGSVLIPAMEKEGYDKEFATAITVASSIVGPIIPPSITLVIYGIVASQPIGKLLVAGVVPGFLVGLTQIIYTYFYAKKKDYPSYPRASFKEVRGAVRHGTSALIMPLIIIGGVLSGVFTPTESAAIAVVYGLVVGVFLYGNVTGKALFRTLKKVGLASSNTLFILSTATIFSWVITMARVPDAVVDLMFKISTNELLLTGLLLLILMVVGLFMLPSQALIVLTPIFVPVAVQIGIDPIHFGVIMVLTLVFGGCTPPVGMMLFVASDISGLSYGKLVRAVLPLYVPIVIAIILVTFVPQLSMFLPNLFFK